MVTFLSLSENLHQILRVLYDDMMRLSDGMVSVCSGIAGIGALLYISYRVWQSLGRAEPIDLFPLLRPFALGLCIMFFQPLVLGSLNGLLAPVANAAHALMKGQTFNMEQWQKKREELVKQAKERLPADSYYVEDTEMEEQLDDLGIDDESQNTMNQMQDEQSSWSLKTLLLKILCTIMEWIFTAASVILDVLRTFYLIVLSILGPLAFAIAVFDGFQNTLVQWFSKYISVYLWLPVSDILGAIISRLQTLSLQHDADMMAQDAFYYFDINNIVNFIFMLVGIVGFFCVPSIAGWIVHASGFGSYNRIMNQVSTYAVGYGGVATGKAWATTKAGAGWVGRKIIGK